MALSIAAYQGVQIVVGVYTFPANGTPVTISALNVPTYTKRQDLRDYLYGTQLAVSDSVGNLHLGNDAIAYLNDINAGNTTLL
jgi:hypothetical protein